MTEFYKIQEGKPIPCQSKYKFDLMEVGQHMDFPLNERSKARAAATNYGLRAQRKFITRSVIENGVWLARVWRIK